MKKILLSISGVALAVALVTLVTAGTFVPANFGKIVHRTVVTSTTAPYTILYSDEYVACTGTNYTVTLPPALVNGLVIKVAAVGTNTVTVSPHGTDTINNGVAITLTTNSVTLTSDGVSNWEL